MKRDAAYRNWVLNRAADLAISGQFASAIEISVELRNSGIDTGLHLSPASMLWLNELCQMTLAGEKMQKRIAVKKG